ncbi:MAG: hypothetical protein ABW124_06040 [Candidatus Thiodiazotropha sp. 6PLUC9]
MTGEPALFCFSPYLVGHGPTLPLDDTSGYWISLRAMVGHGPTLPLDATSGY